MKIIRKLIKGLLVFILIDLIGLLILSCSIQNVIIEGVIKETIKEEFKKLELEEITDGDNGEAIGQITSDEEVQKILNSREVQDLINKYLDITIDGLIDEEKLDDSSIEKDMLEFLDNHRTDLENITGQKISDEEFLKTKEEIKNSNFDKVYKENIIKMNREMPKEEKVVLKGYRYFNSSSFKTIIIISIIIDLILIALVEWSLYKWIKTFANSLIASGVLLTIVSIAVRVIVSSLANYSFNTNSLLIWSVGVIIWGIVIRVIYAIIVKIITQKKEEVDNVISEVSYEE